MVQNKAERFLCAASPDGVTGVPSALKKTVILAYQGVYEERLQV